MYFHCVIVIVLHILTSNNNHQIHEQSTTITPVVISLRNGSHAPSAISIIPKTGTVMIAK